MEKNKGQKAGILGLVFMRKDFFARVMRVVNDSDIVLEILDSRFPEMSRNKKLEGIVKGKGKHLVLVLNKSDLVEKEKAENAKKELMKEFPCVFVSAKEKMGTRKLRGAIGRLSGKKSVRVGVVGYPNTGKSSVINALKGKTSAKAASKAGFTKGEQFVRVSEKVLLIDTPRVFSGEKEEALLALMGVVNAEKIADPEGAAFVLIDYLKKMNTVNIYGNGEPNIFTYGSTTMSVLEALKFGEIEATVIQPIYLNPLPTWILENYQNNQSIVVEMSSTGQFANLLKDKIGISFISEIRKYDGRPFDPIELYHKIKEVV